jgi:hypothetical protein
MPNWLKISLFLLVLVLISLGAALALRFREMPAAASVKFINVAIAEDLQILRQIALESSQVELGADFSSNDVTIRGEAQIEAHVAALEKHLEAIGPLDERVGAIDNPIIVFISLQHNVGANLNSYSYQINSGEYLGEKAPFSEAATLGNPVVSRTLGSDRSVVRYTEVVSTDDNLEISFELYLDMDLLQQKYAEAQPQ